MFLRKYVYTEPVVGTGGSEETPTPEITNTPSSNDFGILEISGTGNTAINYFQIENTGNCAVDVVIYGTDATGGDDTCHLREKPFRKKLVPASHRDSRIENLSLHFSPLLIQIKLCRLKVFWDKPRQFFMSLRAKRGNLTVSFIATSGIASALRASQ